MFLRVISIYLAAVMLFGYAQAEPVRWDKLTLINGKVYEDVILRKKKAHGISILHSTGAAGIPYEQLSIDIQNELGGFDSEKAEVSRDAELDKQRRMKAAWREMDAKAAADMKARKLREEQEREELRLSAAQRAPVDRVRKRPGGIKVSARTVSWKTKRSAYSAVWSRVDSSEAEILAYAEKNKDSWRTLGIDLRCGLSSRGGDYVLEVFWFGFPLANKRKRYICAHASGMIEVLPDRRQSIRTDSHYNYKDAALLYLKSDAPFNEWEGFYARSWSGYTYAGWAVRVSDGFGKVLALQGAQPSFLRYLDAIPVPRIKG